MAYFRRRPREPPSTGQLNAPRRRQPVDPPSSFLQPQSNEPEIQLTARQLELMQRKQGGAAKSGLHQLDPKEEVSFGNEGTKNDTVDFADFATFADENENKPMVTATAAKGKQQHASASSNVSLGSQETSDRPFTTRSNQVNSRGVSRNGSLASRKLGKESRSLAGRSSVFRKRATNDSDTGTVASVASSKSAVTASQKQTKPSVQSGTSDRDRDKAALRKLLGTDSSEAKPSSSVPEAKTAHVSSSQATQPSRPKKVEVQAPLAASRPTKSNVPAPTTTSVDDQFDQKEYVRNLISSRTAAQKSSTAPKKVPSTNSRTSTSTTTTKQSTQDIAQTTKVGIKGSTTDSSAKSSNSGSSSASHDQSAMLRKVISRAMAKKPKEKLKKRLSPKSKGSKSPKFDHGRMENAAMSLSRKVLSDKSSSPKGQPKGLKGYVRSKMGLSKKPSRAKTNPTGSDSNSVYDPTLAKSASSDSADSTRTRDTSNQCITQMASLSSDAGDDDKTRTTTTTSSSHESSLKHLSTAETIDTDESSTIMGNLQSASSDSMQYSSEEGCEDTSVIDKSAFRAIDKISLGGTKYHASYKREHEQTGNARQLAISSENKRQNQAYNDFLEALQAEASGAHSQLWSSFQAVITGSPRRPPFQHETVSTFKFDARTREMLAAMNAHLKRHATVECVTSTQLVNDKKFAREVAVGLTSRPSYSSYKVGESSSKRETPKSRHSFGPGKLSVIHDDAMGEDENRIASCKSAHQAVDVSNAGSTTGVGLQQPIWKNGDIQFCRPNHSVLNDVQPSSGAIASKCVKSRSSIESQHKNESATKPETGKGGKFTGVQQVSREDTTVTLSRPRTSVESKHQLLKTSKSEEEAVPWSGVRLRAVSNPCATGTSSSQVESQKQTKQGGIPSPWAKVKLRRVPDAETEHEQMEENDCLKINVPPHAPESTELSQETSETKAVEDSSASAQSSASALHEKPVTSKKTGETTFSKENMDDSSIVFALKCTGLASNEEKVVISKKMVMLLQSSSGIPKATPAWSLPKDKIKALTLDMESQRVNLSLVESNESKVLSFRNSADCLNFANAFYEMIQPNHHPEHTKSGSVMEEGQDANLMESLSHEEQQVLETYRQARRTKPAVDAMRTAVPNVGSTSDKEETVGALKGPAFLNDILKRKKGNDTSESVVSSIAGGQSTESKSDKQTSKLPLSDKDMEVAESYQKMLKLKIPPDAVQHKMTKEGVHPKIIGYVLGQAGVLPVDTNYPDDFTETDRQIAMLYRSMLKLMVPPEDVRNQMKDDNIDDKIVCVVLGEQNSSASKLSEAEEAIAAPYRKMLKMMIPKEAVRHKMSKDQVDPKIMFVVVGGEQPSNVGEPRLSPEEEKIALSYRKMLKLSLPPEAVRHRMEKDGVDAKIMKAVLGAEPKSGALKSGSSSKAAKSKLVSLHWTPLSGKELRNSVWSATTKRKSQPAGSDISKLVELFQKKNTVKVMKGASSDGNNDTGTGKAKLLDLNRANIIAISLKAFKDFTYDELASILQNIDPLRSLRGERVQFVKDLLPTAAEISSVKRYYGSPDRLVPAEQWFQKIVHIKRLEAKAHVLHTMEVFDTEVAEIKKSLHLLTRVCTQVMESDRLRELLDMVLQIGNIMNEGTRTGGASGFKFDSLLRLTQTKSGDGKTTVLDYMVTIYAAKGQKQTLNLVEDFPECQVASRVLISDLIANVNEVNERMLKCRQEYESLVSETTKVENRPTNGEQQPVGADNGTSISDSRPQPSKETMAKETSENVTNKYIGAIEKTKNNRAKGTKANDVHTGIARLDDFLTNAEDTYKVLKQECDFAVETCREMSKYCGESGGERSTDTLLGILCEFASSLDAAVKKHERVMEAEAKKAAKQASAPKKTGKKPEDVRAGSGTSMKANNSGKQQKSGPGRPQSRASDSETQATKTQTTAAGPETQGKGTSLVLMVNQLLKDASDKTKKDFSQGVVYENPDQTLKAIYEREQKTARSDASPSRRSVAGDIISAINRRQSEDGNAAAKRTQLQQVIDCINCASGAADNATIEDESTVETQSNTSLNDSSHHPADRFQDLMGTWKQLKKRDSESSLVSKRPSIGSMREKSIGGQDEDEGSVHQPIDCTTKNTTEAKST